MRPAALDSLSAAVRGDVLAPGHADFDAVAAVTQLARPCRPAVIVRPADAGDVARAIACARDEGLEIAVRGGGHSAAGFGTGEGSLVIDTRRLGGIAVDPRARRVRIGAGLSAGEVLSATHEHGLAVPLGDTGSVGVAGITLGGGLGYLSREHGMTVDHLRSAELVTADGRCVTATAGAEPDLFWAIRGGGGNFGVVTALEFDLVEAGDVVGGALVLPATRDVLRAIAPLAGAAPRSLGLVASLMPAPRAPFVPPEVVGRPVVMLVGVHNGVGEAADAAWAPFRALARPLADAVAPMRYPAILRFGGSGAPAATASRAALLEVVDDTVVDTLLAALETAPGIRAMLQLRVLGGAIADVAPAATAFAHRSAPVQVVAHATAVSSAELGPCIAWADGVLARLRGQAIGVCANFLEDEGEARIREAYPNSTYRRLAAVKAAWDPDNVFRRNHNIRPAT